jgi:hypothetical protein
VIRMTRRRTVRPDTGPPLPFRISSGQGTHGTRPGNGQAWRAPWTSRPIWSRSSRAIDLAFSVLDGLLAKWTGRRAQDRLCCSKATNEMNCMAQKFTRAVMAATTSTPASPPSSTSACPIRPASATSNCTSKTTGSSRSPHPSTTTSATATRASRAGSASSSSRAGHERPDRRRAALPVTAPADDHRDPTTGRHTRRVTAASAGRRAGPRSRRPALRSARRRYRPSGSGSRPRPAR